MYDLLIKLMILSALTQLGMSFTNMEACRSRHCARNLESYSRKILHVGWKPISVFPKEARRFR